MKKTKILCGLLVAALAFSLTACGRAVPMPAPAEGAQEVPAPAAPAENNQGSESYLVIDGNAAVATKEESMLTLSLKVDTASYSNVQRYIDSGTLPPADAVRTEELLNYFSYDGAMAYKGGEPFAVRTEIAPSPFDNGKYTVLTRVRTQDVDKSELPSSNITFLIDTSGSMNSHDKLPLLKEAFALLVDTLDADDTVSIVTYAGSSQVVLDSVGGDNTDQILDALYRLEAGGSTAGANGIMTAYALAEKNFMRGGNNRVILATDGDFNVGPSSLSALEKLVGEKRDSGVYLSILGFGTGNIRDDVMETLSKNGSGNYSYINNTDTAKKVLVQELGTNLFTVANDVKAQVEFNPQNVKSYRLIGYENRKLENKEFADDTKDAGEIGVGTDVVVLFEVELQDGLAQDLQYGDTPRAAQDLDNELLEVRIRYKNPGETESRLITRPVTFASVTGEPSDDFRFACSVAAFGDLLRGSEYATDFTPDSILSLAKTSLGPDLEGYRLQHLLLLQEYRRLVD